MKMLRRYLKIVVGSLGLLLAMQSLLATELKEQVKVYGFSCGYWNKPMVHLRALEMDRDFT
ncbi:MAG: hypothetical protein NT027_14570, partial [Proteobacteria bacterium]|nr:hypothetical protein [Pseudomonadota bacterium]